jgi:6-phosphogluconolactonase
MNTLRVILISSVALAASAALDAAPPPADGQYVAYVGPYTRPNKSKGIYAYKFDAKAGKFTSIGLAAETSNPSWVAVSPNGKFVYAANENNQGTVSAFAVQPDATLKALNSVSSTGSGPCHVTLDHKGKFLFVANYNDGAVASYAVKEDGSLSAPVSNFKHTGSSANASRQRGPHAHEAMVSPDDKFLFVPDLGIDKIMIYKIDAKTGALTPNEPAFTPIDAGSGPRHMAFAPNGKFVYLVTEMNSSITGFSYDAKTGAMTKLETLPGTPADFTGQKSGAEVAIHPSGKFLYLSNRNHNSVAVFTVDAKGKLTAAGNVPSGGKTPRHIVIDPTGAFLIASHQDSDNITVFKIDPKTGALAPTGEKIDLGSPVCVAFSTAK